MEGWVDGWVGGWVDGSVHAMDGRKDGWMESTVIFSFHSPFSLVAELSM